MSNLLEQALVDAKALKDAAVKSAENELLEKYADEMRSAVSRLLEQEEEQLDEEMAMGGMSPDMAAPAFTDGERLCPCPESDEPQEIDFAQLRAAIEAEEEEAGMDLGMSDEEPALEPAGEEEELELQEDEEIELNLGEELEIVEEDEEINLEALEIDHKPERQDIISIPLEEEEEVEEVASQLDEEETEQVQAPTLTEEEEMIQTLTARNTELEEEIAQLQNQAQGFDVRQQRYRSAIDKITQRLAEVNLSNAKLLYTNRILNNASLNERQRNEIVESITGAGSVEEAKTIFETLQNTMLSSETPKKSAPNTLSEAVKRSVSPFASRGSVPQKQTDTFSQRMQQLAGINK
tara:strand:- start:4555 stop:5607 length:1053 start_codon:yes stop_codon:yes gene_type:complete